MNLFVRAQVFSIVVLALSACSVRSATRNIGGGLDAGTDGMSTTGEGGTVANGPEAGMGYDLGAVNECNPSCGPTELCGMMNDGNGLDDNCNGQVDEGCNCGTSGNTRECFLGPPDRRNIGVCTTGIETCDEFQQWGPCVGSIGPSNETCDGADNDCNGETDDNISSCDSPVHCPENDTSRPLSNYALSGARVYDGTGTNWQWQVSCPASVSSCPAPENPNQKDTQIYFSQSGAYRINVTVTPDGASAPVSCGWTVYVQGDGLRVELDWDTLRTVGTDIDLHVHQWTQNGVDSDFNTSDDCYYANCKASTTAASIWGTDYPDSPLENCEDAPRGQGAVWQTRGACRNPRLDVDMNAGGSGCDPSVTDPQDSDFCAPENVNVDAPILGRPYRIMVDYWGSGSSFDDWDFGGGSDETVYPVVNIYCGGVLRGTFGADPMAPIKYHESWLVADVVFVRGPCGQDCRILPLGDVRLPAERTEFGPSWSCNYDEGTQTCSAP